MKHEKSDVLLSLLSIWGILLFMIFFSLMGKAGAYEEYAREQEARAEAAESKAEREVFADDPADLSEKMAADGKVFVRASDPVTTRQKIGASCIVAVATVTLTACGVAGSRKMREKQEK